MKKIIMGLLALLALAVPASAGAVEGNFLVACFPDSNGARVADPIGGADHVHAFAAVPNVTDFTTPGDMVKASTTCQVNGETVGLWHPAVQKPDGTIVTPTLWNIYYRNNDPTTPAMPFPFGLKHVHGNPNNANPNAYAAVYRCFGYGTTVVYLPSSCPPGNGFQETMFFSFCWDGLGLDETNDGLAHHTMTKCDAAHPIKLPAINLIIDWPQSAVGGKLTSDIEHGTPAGLSAHADYWATFDPFFQSKFVERCLNKGIQCRVSNGASGIENKSLYQFGTTNVILSAAEAEGAF